MVSKLLSSLSREETRVLEVLAILEAAEVEAIAQIMQLPSIQVIQVLDDLSRRGWIYEQEESGHLLLRDRFGLIETLLYERMPRYKRMELHRLALDYYELRRQQSSGDLFYLTQLCRHSSHTYNTQKKVYYHILHLERVLDYFDEFFPTIVDDTIQYNERWLISREETYARFQQYSAELQALEAELPSSQYYELLMKLYFLRSIELYEQFDTYWLRSIAESSLAMIYAAGDSRDRALEHFRKAEVFSQKEMAQEELAVLEQARCVLKEAGIL